MQMQSEWARLRATKHLFCLQHSTFVCPPKTKPAICCKWAKSMWSLLASGNRKTKSGTGTHLSLSPPPASRKIFATNANRMLSERRRSRRTTQNQLKHTQGSNRVPVFNLFSDLSRKMNNINWIERLRIVNVHIHFPKWSYGSLWNAHRGLIQLLGWIIPSCFWMCC